MSVSDKVAVLKRSSIFAGLSDEDLGGLARITVARDFADGEFIFWEGDSPEWFYIVCAGQVKVVKSSSSGRDFIIAFFSPGEIFGEVAVFENKPYPASAQSVEKTTVLGIRNRDFLSFLAANPSVALKIISILGGRLRDAQNRLKDLAGERVEQSLYTIMLMLSSKYGPSLPFTRKEIADMSGTTTETTIRVLSRLKEGKIIGSTRGKIIILDERKLRLLSEGPPHI